MDQCEAVGHSARRRHRHCNQSQQAGRFDSRRNRAVAELDIESIDVDSHGGVNFEHLQMRNLRLVHAKYGLHRKIKLVMPKPSILKLTMVLGRWMRGLVPKCFH